MADTLTFTEKVRDLFLAHPNQWLDGMTLAQVAGQYAWRSRVSDARRFFHLHIENRVRVFKDRADGKFYKKSEYRYVPRPGELRQWREATAPAPEPTPAVTLTEGRLF